MELITSKENMRYKGWKSLQTKKGRNERNLFMVEGLRSMEEAAKKGSTPTTLILREDEEVGIPSFLEDEKMMEVIVLKEHLFSGLCETVNPQNHIGVYKKMEWYVDDLVGKGPIIYLDGIQDPGNLGTLIRSAVAFNAGGLVLGDGCGDVFNSKVVRSSLGGLFAIPFITGGTPLLRVLKGRGYQLIGCDMEGNSIAEESFNDTKLIIGLGNENQGLSEGLKNICDKMVAIPMEGMESLNASVAGSIFLCKTYMDRK